ncbi:enoyl-CoA hydratase [Frankia sp. Cppng1_Ct_nod]|uniref:enoyl-CoA hydratase n=1 Tax=Frankia sp. Cppng1_Ct_nod TaxID=2897162 RepID=UPI001040EEAE|nr:enoyl-CoA hydratase [Frankia sp. Cppng1_Ct_nod]
MTTEVTVDVQPPAAIITLNRPKVRNAITPEMIDELRGVITELNHRDDVRAIVLTGADPAFCAGLDLVAVGEGRFSRAADWDKRPFDGVLETTKPLIGAINGATVTGGLEWALCCDFRIASERARFADTHARVGVMPGGGLTWRLPRAVGFAWARQMSFTGNYVDAAQALRIGLVNEVVPHESLLPRALEIAANIATIPAGDLADIRAMYHQSELGTAVDAATNEREVARRRRLNADEVASRRSSVIERGRGQIG